MSYKKIWQYIRLIDKKNTDGSVNRLLWVSIEKKFIKSIANTSWTDMTVYRVINKNQFAYSPVTSRNGDKFTIALFKENDSAILSPAYQVFEIIDQSKIIPEYLFLWFNRPEFDRYTRFNSWGSAREIFDWETLCNIELLIPPIEEQRKYVALYSWLINNQKSYEMSISDLQFICDTYIENLIKKGDTQRLWNHIERVTNKNSDDKIKNVLWISERKEFRVPSWKVNKENLSGHLLVRKNEFAYIPRMNPFKPLAIALSNSDEIIIVSWSYVVFKIKKQSELLPEFLLLFFKRWEFDRYAAYNAWSSTRDTFDWEEMCNVNVPVPEKNVQEAIVTMYHTLEERKRINQKLKESIKPLCPILMRWVVVNTH